MWIEQEIIPRRIIGIINELWQGYFNMSALGAANTICSSKYNFTLEFRGSGARDFVFSTPHLNRMVCTTTYNSVPIDLFVVIQLVSSKKYSIRLDSTISQEDLIDMLLIFYKELSLLCKVK